MLSVAGVDYALSGFQWADPSHVTYSIAPDGVFWGHGANNLNATLDARLGAGAWEREVAKALATWEAVAAVNIGQASDSAHDLDTPGLSQGDPRFGDVRFGGYPYANDTKTLAQTYFPPPNGSTAAGDVAINTALPLNRGSDYDLFSVLLHETGHSLGLDHATNPAEVLFASYHGVQSGLAPGDIAGIQALYGPRTQDAYQRQGRGLDVSTAVDLTAALDANGRASLPGVSLATIGDTEYFRVTAPAGADGALGVTAATAGLSLLSPKISLYDASGRLLDAEANPSAWGDDVSAHTNGVTPGQTFTVAVTGATGDVFSVGAYVLHVNFGTNAPIVAPPRASVPVPAPAPPAFPAPPPQPPASPAPLPTTPAVPPDRFEPNDSAAQATPLGTVTQTVVPFLSLHDGNDRDDFVFQNARAGVYLVTANGANVRVFDARGHTLASGANSLTFRAARPHATLFVEVTSANGGPLASYGLGISLVPPASVHVGRARPPRPHRVFRPHVLAPASSPTAHLTTPAWARPWASGRASLGGRR